jgi:hypothetical protein
MPTSLESIKQFVESAQTIEPFRTRGGADANPGLTSDTLAASLDAAKNQATVVASDVIAFVNGISAEGREAIINSSLLAQLVTKKKVTDPDDVEGWYRTYFETITNLGWVIQEKLSAEYKQTAMNFETHKAVLAVAATFLGAGATALTLVTSAINALHSMNEQTPWITIFDRESQHAKTARFQITLVEPGPKEQFLVSMLAFGMKADKTITQVLFFSAKMDQVRLRHDSCKLTIAPTILTPALPALRAKLSAHLANNIAVMEI